MEELAVEGFRVGAPLLNFLVDDANFPFDVGVVVVACVPDPVLGNPFDVADALEDIGDIVDPSLGDVELDHRLVDVYAFLFLRFLLEQLDQLAGHYAQVILMFLGLLVEVADGFTIPTIAFFRKFIPRPEQSIKMGRRHSALSGRGSGFGGRSTSGHAIADIMNERLAQKQI